MARDVGLQYSSSNEGCDLHSGFAEASTGTITGQVTVSGIEQVLRRLWRIDFIVGAFPSSWLCLLS